MRTGGYRAYGWLCLLDAENCVEKGSWRLVSRGPISGLHGNSSRAIAQTHFAIQPLRLCSEPAVGADGDPANLSRHNPQNLRFPPRPIADRVTSARLNRAFFLAYVSPH